MANPTGRSSDEYKEILEYLRQKVRQFGFSEADSLLENLMEERQVDSVQKDIPARDALRIYMKELLNYLRIFSEESVNQTENFFKETFGRDIEMSFKIGFDIESTGEIDQQINLKSYQRCSALIDELSQIMERIDSDWPPYNFTRNRPDS